MIPIKDLFRRFWPDLRSFLIYLASIICSAAFLTFLFYYFFWR